MPSILGKVFRVAGPAIQTGIGVAALNPALAATGAAEMGGGLASDFAGNPTPQFKLPTPQPGFGAAPSAPVGGVPDFTSSTATGLSPTIGAGSGGGSDMLNSAIAQALQQYGIGGGSGNPFANYGG